MKLGSIMLLGQTEEAQGQDAMEAQAHGARLWLQRLLFVSWLNKPRFMSICFQYRNLRLTSYHMQESIPGRLQTECVRQKEGFGGGRGGVDR